MEFQELTNSEKVVMKCIWMGDHHMVLPEVLQLVNDNFAKNWKSQTASTFLKHLVQKGYLNMYREGKLYKYEPLVREEDYAAHLLKQHIDFWNNGDMKKFANSLHKEETLSKEELHELKGMLDNFE